MVAHSRILFQGLIPETPDTTAYWTSRQHHLDELDEGVDVSWSALPNDVYAAQTPAELARTELGEAAQALLVSRQLLAAPLDDFDAVVIGIVQDTGLSLARTFSPVPVIGYGQAACLSSKPFADRAGLLLFNPDLGALIERRFESYAPGLLTAIESVELGYPDLLGVFDDPQSKEHVAGRLHEACERLVARGAEVIIPGQMLLAEAVWKLGLSRVDGVTVLDGLAASIYFALCQARLAKAGARNPARGFRWAKPGAPARDLVIGMSR